MIKQLSAAINRRRENLTTVHISLCVTYCLNKMNHKPN